MGHDNCCGKGCCSEEDKREFAMQPDGTYMITGDMIIGDVVDAFPQAASIMLSFGLHCVGCHANAFDTVEAGAAGHGMTDEEITRMIGEINLAVNKKIDIVELTQKAVAKVKELRAKETGKESWPLRIKVNESDDGFVYDMDFYEKEKDDIVVAYDGLEVVIDPTSLPRIKGSSVDYVETLSGSGFKIENPNTKKGCGCGQ